MVDSGKYLTKRLEDGEKVVRLRGRAPASGWKSSWPHAGLWGEKTAYVLIPCRTLRQVTRRSKVALSSVPGLENRSSDLEVLLLGSLDSMETLITQGPMWCRARISRKGQPRTEAQSAAFDRYRSTGRMP